MYQEHTCSIALEALLCVAFAVFVYENVSSKVADMGSWTGVVRKIVDFEVVSFDFYFIFEVRCLCGSLFADPVVRCWFVMSMVHHQIAFVVCYYIVTSVDPTIPFATFNAFYLCVPGMCILLCI